MKEETTRGSQISLAQGVSDTGRFEVTKYMVAGGVRKAPERLRCIPVRPSAWNKAVPDPVLQAEARLIAGN